MSRPAMVTEPITFLSPPGRSVLDYKRALAASGQQEHIPSAFRDAMAVREAVFVDEQRIPAENELDADDARSFHWVVYASVAQTIREGGRKGRETSKVAVGTIRLVPPPHPPSPAGTAATRAVGSAAQQRVHDGKEPYIKLGRLATLPAYRGLGIGRLLVNSALEWASENPLSIIPWPSTLNRSSDKGERVLADSQERWKGLVLAHAQRTVQDVWRKYGFQTDESMGIWSEEGIEHVGMWRRIPVQEERAIFK